MSNIPLYAAVVGVFCLIFGILKDTMFEPGAILLAILGIVAGSLITLLVTGDPS